jgi:hypothetical protein
MAVEPLIVPIYKYIYACNICIIEPQRFSNEGNADKTNATEAYKHTFSVGISCERGKYRSAWAFKVLFQ